MSLQGVILAGWDVQNKGKSLETELGVTDTKTERTHKEQLKNKSKVYLFPRETEHVPVQRRVEH